MARLSVLEPGKEAILREIAQYHYLTAIQVVRALGHQPASISKVGPRLAALFCDKYLWRQPIPTTKGRPSFVYQLASKGRDYLARLGEAPDGRLRYETLHTYFLSHILLGNDFLIAAKLLNRTDPRVELREWRHELDLKRQPTEVEVASGTSLQLRVRTSVYPDGWLDFAFGDRHQSLLLEIDRATERQLQWKEKIRKLLAYVDGPYQRRFGNAPVNVAVVTDSPRRLGNLLLWTEEELERLGQADWAELFLMASQDPVTLSPAELFFGGHWRIPFQRIRNLSAESHLLHYHALPLLEF